MGSTNETDAIPLTADLLISAYRQGIFPMGEPGSHAIFWYRPDPRAVIDLDQFHVPRRLAKTMRSGRFRFTVDACFARVMELCARWEKPDEAWITPEMIDLYGQLHNLGIAHSIEAWQGDDLAGGLYGVALGGAFMGESMFHIARDASKASLVFLIERLRSRGYVLLDTQFSTPHLERFGVRMIPHSEYQRRLNAALEIPATFS